MERVYLCPGSSMLERKVKELPKQDSVRDAGSRIHAVMAGEIERAVLDEDELWMVERLEEYEQEVVRLTFPGKDLVELQSFREERLYLEVDGVIENSGEFDKVYLDGAGDLLINDYKTGYIAVTDASQNFQLRNYAVLVWLYFRERMPVERITVCAIQPRSRPAYPRCTYSVKHLQLALDELLLLIGDAKNPEAKRFPSLKACTYCKALSLCPEAASHARESMETLRHLVMRLPIVDESDRFSPEDIALREAILPGKDLADAFKSLKFLDKYDKAVSLEARVRLMSGAVCAGLELKGGITRRSVRDVWTFRERIKDFISPREIMDALHPSATAAKELIAPKMPHLKGKVLQAAVDDILTGITTESTNRPSVVLTKE